MNNISFFEKGFAPKGTPHLSKENISIIDFLNKVKYGEWKNNIQPIREQPNKEIRTKLKTSLGGITISGTFIERKEANLIAHSGFIGIDIDNNNNYQSLIDDPYVYSIFTSVSGLGFCAIFKIEPSKHKESFNWIRNYLFNTYGFVADEAPKNVASLRYVSYDPDLYLNEKSKKCKFLVEKKITNRALPVILSEDKFSQLVKEAINKGLNITDTYDDYMKVAFAIANGFGELGRNNFHALAQMSMKYDSVSAEKQYNIALQDKGSKKITIGYLYWVFKNNGLVFKNEDQHSVTAAVLAKKNKRSKEATISQLEQLNGLSHEQAEQLVHEVYNRDDISPATISGDTEKLIENVAQFIQQNYNIKKNIITAIYENNGSIFTKEAFNTCYLKTKMLFNTKEITSDLIEKIIMSEFTPQYSPIMEYIDSNRYRNTSGNLDSLARTINTHTNNHIAFVRKWFIGMIALIHGHPCRLVLTLVGGQNTGKTEFFRRLLPSKLKQYYAESKLDAGKDDDILMCQKLVVMDDEMGGKSKADEKRLKELTSKQIFSLRAPYAKHNEDFKRLAILCGTSNETDIISDPTGNTRILPINVISINHDAYNSIDKDELFMEAVRAYESGERFEMTKDELIDLDSVSKEFETTPYERELLLQYLMPPEGIFNREWMSTTEIKNYIEQQSSKQQIRNLKKLGIELRKLFGEAKSIRINGFPVKKYAVSKLSMPIKIGEDSPF
jgi:hypothetical protein